MKIFVSAMSVALVSFVAIEQAQASCGNLEVAKGDVKVEGADKVIRVGAAGGKVCSGETVIAGPDSRAKLKMEDGNELNISPDSKIVFENYQFEPAQNKKKVLLNVLQGKVRAATKQENMYNDKSADGSDNSFQVKTKTAVAGVRGTDFLTGYDPKTKTSQVVTFRGNVSFGQLGPGGQVLNAVSVKAGQSTSAISGKAPAPAVSLPPAQLQQMNSDTKADTSASGSNSASSSNKTASKDPNAGSSSGTAAAGSGSAASGNSSGSAAAGTGNASSTASTAAPTTTSTDASRAPASIAVSSGAITSGSMLNSSDLGGAAGTTGPAAIASPLTSLPTVANLTPVSVVPVVPVCQQCLALVQNSPTKLVVRVHYGN